MGSHAYWYFVPFQPNAQAALDELREREFRSGRYNPVMWFPFPLGADAVHRFGIRVAPSPGNKHRSIAAAIEDAQESGTRSILDLNRVGDEADFYTARRMPPEELEEFFGTEKPTRQMVEDNMDWNNRQQEPRRGRCGCRGRSSSRRVGAGARGGCRDASGRKKRGRRRERTLDLPGW
jgi:hypothetical protein